MTGTTKIVLTCDVCEKRKLAITSGMVPGILSQYTARVYASSQGWSVKAIDGARLDLCPGCTANDGKNPDFYISPKERQAKT